MSFTHLIEHETVQIWVHWKGHPWWTKWNNGAEARVHKVVSFFKVAWYLTVKTICTANFLDSPQEDRIFLEFVKTALKAIPIFWHQRSIVKLRKGVLIRNEQLPPLCPVMSILIYWEWTFHLETRIWLPFRATWEALILFQLPWLCLNLFATIWRVPEGFLCLCQGPVKGLLEYKNL